MSDYRIKVSVRNARILKAIDAAGYRSVKQFADAEGIIYSSLCSLIALRAAPIGESGSFTKPAKQIMEALGLSPVELWTPEQLNANLPRSTYERDVATDDIGLLVEQMHAEAVKALTCDGTISGREESIIEGRFTHDQSYEEVSDWFGVTRERVRQIEAKALRKMRGNVAKHGIQYD